MARWVAKARLRAFSTIAVTSTVLLVVAVAGFALLIFVITESKKGEHFPCRQHGRLPARLNLQALDGKSGVKPEKLCGFTLKPFERALACFRRPGDTKGAHVPFLRALAKIKLPLAKPPFA
jgi:hypothetical protein